MMTDSENRKVIMIGFMGAGKSSLGRRLAAKWNCRFIDTDDMIVEEQKRSINEIFDQEGEQYFRDLETDLLKRLKETDETMVIAAGGGLPLREENRRILREMGEVVYLEASVDTLEKRLKGDKKRPMLRGGELRERITALMNAREEIYRAAATMILCTDHREKSESLEVLDERLSY